MKKQNNEMIKTTSSDIKKLSSIVKFSSNEGSKTNRLMLEKLVEEFHVVAEKYVGAEKALDIKIRKTVLVNVDGAEEESDDDDINMSHQQQKLINAEIKFENKLLANREERMTKIESEVIDINQIMNEISTLIQGLFYCHYISSYVLHSRSFYPQIKVKLLNQLQTPYQLLLMTLKEVSQSCKRQPISNRNSVEKLS